MTHYNRITLDLIQIMMDSDTDSGEFTKAVWDWHKLSHNNPKAFKENLWVIRKHLMETKDD